MSELFDISGHFARKYGPDAVDMTPQHLKPMTDTQFAAEVQNKAAQIALLAVQVELQETIKQHPYTGSAYREGFHDGLSRAVRVVHQHLQKLGLERLEKP
jgi:hypothetical protein